jgi:ankyrin repeat protein
MIQLLLAHGADVHKRTVQHDTALDVAANTGHVKCAKALIAAGADVNSIDSGGARSLDHAIIMHRSAVAQLLLENGAKAVMNDLKYADCAYGEDCCVDGLTALMMCTEVDTLKVLLAAGADVHVRTHAADTCLHLAAKHEASAAMICLLIKAGADLHAVNSKGKTPAQVAHDRGYTFIEQLIVRAAQQGH